MIDNNGGAFTVGAAGSLALTNASSCFLFMNDATHFQTALYQCTGASCVMSAAGGSAWVASTTTPAANTSSVALSGGKYTVFNGWGVSVTYHQIVMCP